MDFQNTQVQFFLSDLPHCSSSTPSPTYDVFLSFRGADTRRNFTDHLYNALIRAGIHTFRDDDELPRGNDISSELLKAIKESRFSIVVFSKNYASSRWCLEELVNILDPKKTNGQLFIPVFYHVKPSEIRKQKGSFKDAFASHEKHVDHEKVNKWRAALREAADLAGWSVNGSRNETEDIDQIVEKIFPYVNRELVVCKHPVGLQSRVEHLKSLLRVGSDGVCVVGFYGMGGIGKTTLARAFFNAFIRQFESGCFVTNVREESRHSRGLVLLQKQLLYDLNGKDYNIQDVYRGINLIKEGIGRRRVLIVLDDLDHVRQFDYLIGSRSCFRKESLIIITTRDKHLLDETQADVKYEVKELNHLESLELFSRHALNCLTPSKIYERILESIVCYARGHPLALEVIGSSLVYKPIEYWKSMCERLKVIPNGKVQKILRISFDALDDSTLQDMFLDIACFFMTHALHGKQIIDACFSFGSYGISNLMDRCLLQNDYPIRMHDLLQQMGKQIVQEKFPKEPGKHTRLWDPELVCDVLENDKGTELVEGIELQPRKQMQFSTKSFAKMPNLRILQMRKVYLDGSFRGLFKELRWLCWDMCPLEHLSDFYPTKLVYLKMQYNNLHTLWTTTKGHFGHSSGCEILFSKQDIPNLFEYQRMEGYSISFDVPSDVQSDFSHLKFWTSGLGDTRLIHVNNKTSGNKWESDFLRSFDHSILIYGRQEYQMKRRDRIEVSFQSLGGHYIKVDKCGVHLVCTKEGVHGGNSDLSRHSLKDRANLKRGRDLNPGEASCSKSKLSRSLKYDLLQFYNDIKPVGDMQMQRGHNLDDTSKRFRVC